MAQNSIRLVISPDTKSIFEECRKEFMEYNKSFDGLFLSQDFLLRRICRYYLDQDLDESVKDKKRG
jgi:hypothetical protein